MLTWEEPDITREGLLDYHILRHRPELGEAGPLVYVDFTYTSDTTFTDTDVEPGVLYVYQVKAVMNFFGDRGEASDPIEIRMPGSQTSQTTEEATPNRPATGAPLITGTAQVGEMLTADTSGIEDADGLDNATFSYQWLADDAHISGATDASYTLVDTDVGKTIKVEVTFTDDGGNQETLTSAGTEEVAARPNRIATGQPTISGIAQVGERLTADTGGISDEDGLNNATFNYQWLGNDTDIAGATDSSYTLTDADEGKAIKVWVSFTDDAGNDETLTSAATAAVALPPPPLTAQFLDTPSSHDGTNTFTFEVRFSKEFKLSYKTLRDHAFTVTGGEVTNARRLERPSNMRWEITVRPDSDADATVVLPVTGDCNAPGATCTVDGRPLSNRVELTVTGPQGSVQNTPATGLPTISGTAQVGEMLTADTSGIKDAGGLDNVSFSYQWLADDAHISGATDASYTLVDTDVGKTIKVEVTFTDDGGNQETLTSAGTKRLPPVPTVLPPGFRPSAARPRWARR